MVSKSDSGAKWLKEFSSYVEENIEGEGPSGSKGSSEFSSLFEKTSSRQGLQQGDVVKAKVLSIGHEHVTVDVGFKCEAQVPVYEFRDAQGNVSVHEEDQFYVYIDWTDVEDGVVYASKDKANIIRAWDEIAQACEKEQVVEGVVLSKAKTGYTADIGVKAFLPISQTDPKEMAELRNIIGKKLKFRILKFNKKRGTVVLSRKVIISQERGIKRDALLSQLEEGQIVMGKVKNITEYGAFIDLGGVDGLLHITDMSWGRIKHPSELFKINDEVKVKVLKFDRDKERVSLGVKQVEPNPWEEVEYKYPVGKRIKGKVVSLKDYGAFVELEGGVEGLIHVSEMSWVDRIKRPSKILKPGEEVECQVLEVDMEHKRISLGIKQLLPNPWEEFAKKYPVGSIVEGVIRSITDFGLFVDVGAGVDGLIHISDVSWQKKVGTLGEKFKKGDKIRAVVLSIDPVSEKFSLGLKQLEKDPWDNIKARYRAGQAIEGKITKLTDFGGFLEIEEGIEGLIYVSEISEKHIQKPSDVLKVGQKLKAEILSIDVKERRIALSIRQLSRTEEKKYYQTYVGDSARKSSMGEVLGDKLKAAFGKTEDPEDKK